MFTKWICIFVVLCWLLPPFPAMADRPLPAFADTTGGKEKKCGMHLAENWRLHPGNKISLDVHEMDIYRIFTILKRASGKNFAVNDDVKGKVTLTFTNPVHWKTILNVVLKMNGLGKKYVGEDTIWIYRLKDFNKCPSCY